MHGRSYGSVFNVQGANEFNNFISNLGLVKVQLEGYSFTWSHPSATKMSKLDRFLVTEGLVSLFPHTSGILLDRHLLDHRPILLREVITDYGAMPFRMYHSWFSLHGFEQMMTHTWNSIVLDDRNGMTSFGSSANLASGDDRNGMVRFKKKIQFLKKEIRVWVMDQKQKQLGRIKEIKSKLSDIDELLDQGGVNDEILLSRMDLLKQMQDIKSFDAHDCMQKAKIQWAIEGDENSKFFHGDPLAPYLFILIMESLHLLFSRAVDARIFTGIKIDSSLTISHLFYADDAVFIGEWSDANLTGVGTSNDTITAVALNLGCSVMKTPFKYLGVMVG
nr:RNA-directed DNA polymerase, eukaryota [Tanacetum cinerariifolium]